MPVRLLSLDDSPGVELDKPVLLIGRHPECDVQIESRKVSRRHCCIALVNDTLVIRDLGSTNGIRINGTRVTEGRLNVGDELCIGNNRYRVSLDEAVAAPGSLPTIPPSEMIDPLEDDLLESCDDPVPLAEPGQRKPKFPLVAPLSPARAPAPKPESRILPDVLEIVHSDSFPNLPPQAPESRSSI